MNNVKIEEIINNTNGGNFKTSYFFFYLKPKIEINIKGKNNDKITK